MDLNPSFEQRSSSRRSAPSTVASPPRAGARRGGHRFRPGSGRRWLRGRRRDGTTASAGGSGASLLDLGSSPRYTDAISARATRRGAGVGTSSRAAGGPPPWSRRGRGRQILTVALAPRLGHGVVCRRHGRDAVLVLDDRCVALVGLADARTPVHNLAPSRSPMSARRRPARTFGGERPALVRDGARRVDGLTAAPWSGSVAALELAVDYARRARLRRAHRLFQAVAHRLADAAPPRRCHLLSREAAWASEGDPAGERPRSDGVCLRRGGCPGGGRMEPARPRGYGFMLEYDVQLYFRRAKGGRRLLGPRRVYAVSVPGRSPGGPDVEFGSGRA